MRSKRSCSNRHSGDGQGVAQEALRVRQKREGIAVELAVVQKLHPVEPPEAGDAEQALWHLELQPLRAAEQHRSGPKQHTVAEKAEAPQQVGRVSAHRLLKPPTPDRLRNRPPNLCHIEVVDRPLPAAGWFSQHCSLCIRSKSIRLYSIGGQCQ